MPLKQLTFVLKRNSGEGQYGAGDHRDWSREPDEHMAQVLV